jgi:hypothetical protein
MVAMNFGRNARLLTIILPALSFACRGEAGPVVRDVPAPQGIVLTGGNVHLDFADAQFGFETANLDRLDEVVWSGGTGALATTNLVNESGTFPGASDPEDFFGESLGVSLTSRGDDPFVINNGYASVASNQTATTLTTTTTGKDFQGNATNVPIASTDYTVYAAGDPDQNEFQISRTINFTSATPIYPSPGVRFYIPYVSGTYFIVLYPTVAGAINSLDSSDCNLICEVTDWNGQWFADDDDSGSGMLVVRDPASLAPAQLVVAYEEESAENLTSIAVLQPSSGFKAPVTETEWVCFYDRSTWTFADQQAGNLPKGCAQAKQAPDTTPDAFSFTAVTGVAPSSTQTSNTVTITGINAPAPIGISSGTYSVNGAAYTSAGGSVNQGDTVALRGIAAASYSANTLLVLTVGGVSGAFSITTQSAPPPPVVPVNAAVSGHVGGGGSLEFGSLCALLILVLVQRTCSSRRSLTIGAATAFGATVLLGASSARADEATNSVSPYVGIRAGVSNYQFSPADLESRLGGASSDIDSVTISKRQFGGMLYGGLPIYRSLMLELSYVQLGQFPLSIKATSADVAALAQRILGQLAPAGHGVTAGFALPLQFGSLFGIESRLSALYYQSKQVVEGGTADYRNDLRGMGLDAGLSTTFRVAAPLYVGVGADCLHMTQACNVLLYTAQIEYRFGQR